MQVIRFKTYDQRKAAFESCERGWLSNAAVIAGLVVYALIIAGLAGMAMFGR